MTATYTYRPNGDVETITYGNEAQVIYTYDHHRLSSIEHLKPSGTLGRLLRLAYQYDARDLPTQITEYPESVVWILNPSAATTFTYDHRGRLTHELRVTYAAPTDPTRNYILDYEYDAGGNRTVKVDSFNHLRVEYHYDVDAEADPSVYKSRNNRLMWYETWNMTQVQSPVLVSTTYYDYTYDSTYSADKIGKSDGNVTRIITEYPCNGGSSESTMSGGGGGEEMMLESGTVGTRVVPDDATFTETESAQATPSPNQGEGWGEGLGEGGGGPSALMGPGGPTCDGCGAGKTRYRATRFGYANNGQAVTFAHDEAWCWDHQSNPTGYTVTWAREFRYDGARARYMNRPLDATTLNPHATLPTVWTDYDGDEPYRDFTVGTVPPYTVTNGDEYQPGLWRKVSGASDYLHSDMLGTLRQTSGTTGVGGTPRVFTAFGEKLTTTSDRYGYVGAWGYQAHEEFPFLHVGARYYDPSSGRFLQRDPIGIFGGRNVYGYVDGAPSNWIDPSGLQRGGIPTVPGRPAPRPTPRPPFNDIPNTPVPELPSNDGPLVNLIMVCTGGNLVPNPPAPDPGPCSCGKPPYDGHHLHAAPDSGPSGGACGSGGGSGGGAASGGIGLLILRFRRRPPKFLSELLFSRSGRRGPDRPT